MASKGAVPHILQKASCARQRAAWRTHKFGDAAYCSQLLEGSKDEQLVGFWRHVASPATGEIALSAVAPYNVSKVTQIVSNPLLRPILCASHTTLDSDLCLAEGRTVLINLCRGIVGGPDAALLGGVLSIRLFAAAMARARLPQEFGRPIPVVMAEFPSYASTVLGEALAELRKYGLQLVLPNQGLGQIDGRGADIEHVVLANVASLCAFRLGAQDAGVVAETLGDARLAPMLMRLPNGRCLTRLMTGGAAQPLQLVRSWTRGPGLPRVAQSRLSKHTTAASSRGSSGLPGQPCRIRSTNVA